MEIDIYKITNIKNYYLSVPAGTNVAALNLPENLDKKLFSRFMSSMALVPLRDNIGIDPEDVINQINQDGYATHTLTIA